MFRSVLGTGVLVRTVHSVLTWAVTLVLFLHDTDLWRQDDTEKMFRPLCFVFLVLFSVVLYFVVSLMDPGYVLSDCDEKFHLLVTNKESDGMIVENPNLVSLRRCGYCLLKQPMRARHCKSCQHCVRRFDHHCPWIENCVGEKNHPLFILYLCVQLLVLLWAFHLGWSGFLSEATWKEWLKVNVFLLAAFVLTCIFTLVVSLLLVSHLYLISCNTTTWEFMSHHRIAYLKHCDSDTNPFDKGIIRNLWSFFCTFGTVAWERMYYRESYATV
ncbi:probable palmitoyltransferase ZDHHC12 [Pelobates cultripes]|uniref:Palmitoyltransferase n=2 Tax=Pelobates cultripes TaxID=61616 RepID=A0AAD1T2F0_PELCU|nr:probable palmitoyltransferase ZDHHC12 [Pelobates cultripes]